MHRSVSPAAETGSNAASWAYEALALVGDLPGVRRVGLALAEGGGRRLRFTASDRDAEQGPEWCYVDAYDDVPLNTAVRTGQPVIGALDELEGRYPALIARQRRTTTVALAAIPIVSAGQTLGGYVLFYDRPQAFDKEQLVELSRLGDELGAALRHSQRGQARSLLDLSAEPVPPGALAAVHEVPADPEGVGEARRFLRRTLQEWGVDADTIDTAELCLSELVTNAVMHTQAGCGVRVLLDQGTLTTTVRDFGAQDATPVKEGDDPLQTHGRGLLLVDALASRWGSELDSVGTTVWFVLETGDPVSGDESR